MLRLLFYALIVYLGYRFFRGMLGVQAPRERPQREPPTEQEAELERDPQCGAYLLRKHGVKAVVDGQELIFCSRRCRDQYLKTRRAS
ncbi:MAG: hypothetical protein AUK55_07560 [Syntrophobacteraceae bacterium CG2_30_61_12]|nr:MAG: hypothetical protein AUK55_07560 [Syntrophobacteraceae bacterium CG2_30_61_12]PIU31380.1 MAG: hypothetical protein COT06_08460 [Syntrophobacteraceae bacterium CG07_land_8_20_14_0_80_61_8]